MSDGNAFHTPSHDESATLICRRVALLSYYWPYVSYALEQLAEESNWLQVGDITPEQASQEFALLLANFYDEVCMNIPIGSVLAFAMVDLPSGFLVCDGAEYTSLDYPLLYAAIDDSLKDPLTQTFVTPDLRFRFPLGSDQEHVNPIGTQGGHAEITILEDHIPQHSHEVDAVETFNINPGTARAVEVARINGTKQTGNYGYGPDTIEIWPPFTMLKYGIRAV